MCQEPDNFACHRMRKHSSLELFCCEERLLSPEGKPPPLHLNTSFLQRAGLPSGRPGWPEEEHKPQPEGRRRSKEDCRELSRWFTWPQPAVTAVGSEAYCLPRADPGTRVGATSPARAMWKIVISSGQGECETSSWQRSKSSFSHGNRPPAHGPFTPPTPAVLVPALQLLGSDPPSPAAFFTSPYSPAPRTQCLGGCFCCSSSSHFSLKSC